MTQATLTKHTCGGPAFGKRTPGCPRCDELAAGAAPREQAWRKPHRFSLGDYGRTIKETHCNCPDTLLGETCKRCGLRPYTD